MYYAKWNILDVFTKTKVVLNDVGLPYVRTFQFHHDQDQAIWCGGWGGGGGVHVAVIRVLRMVSPKFWTLEFK